MVNLAKAKGFQGENNWQQVLRYAHIAATKLKQLKDCPIENMDNALRLKFNALIMLGRHKEALECAKEWYCMYLTKHTHSPAIHAGFAVIESCMHNKEYFDAVLYARTTWETIILSRDSHIADIEREEFTAHGAIMLAKALRAFAQDGGMPADEQQEAGREAMTLARRALEIHTQLHGLESFQVANDMLILGSVLDYFNDVDDDEVLRLCDQAKAIYARVQGSFSVNVAVCEKNKGIAYNERAERALAVYDLDRCIVNLEQALPHYHEAARIFRTINHVERADEAARDIDKIEERLQEVMSLRTAATRG